MMKIADVELQRPNFWRLTRAVGFAVVLWTIATLLPIGEMTAWWAGALLIAITGGCISSEIGLDFRKGGWHFLLSFAISLALSLLYCLPTGHLQAA